jgi:hypothetical protein
MLYLFIPALFTFAGAIICNLSNCAYTPGWWIGFFVGIVIDIVLLCGGEGIDDAAKGICDSLGDIDFD